MHKLRVTKVTTFLQAAVVTLFATVGVAQAQVAFPPPGPGLPVDFVACPELTAGGSWVATDPVSYFTYSLAGAVPPLPNRYIRVSGVVSPIVPDVPGWLLTPIKVVVGRTPCRSAGILQPPRGSFFPFFGYTP